MNLPPDRLGVWLDRVAQQAPQFIDVYKAAALLLMLPLVFGGIALLAFQGSGIVALAFVAAGITVALLFVRRYHPDSRR